MLHAWTLTTLTGCALLAFIALLRGGAGLVVAPKIGRKVEALWLALTGLAGIAGVLLTLHRSL